MDKLISLEQSGSLFSFLFCFFYCCFFFFLIPTVSEVDCTCASDVSHEQQFNMPPLQIICSVFLGTAASLHCERAASRQRCCNQTKEVCLRTPAHSLT